MPVSPTATVTVRAVAIAEAAVAVTVTDVAPAPSAMLDGAAVSVTAGFVSASVSVVSWTYVTVLEPEMPMVSSPRRRCPWSASG